MKTRVLGFLVFGILFYSGICFFSPFIKVQTGCLKFSHSGGDGSVAVAARVLWPRGTVWADGAVLFMGGWPQLRFCLFELLGFVLFELLRSFLRVGL